MLVSITFVTNFLLVATDPTLSDLTVYAQKFTESPRADIDDWEHPVYINFHKSLVPSFFSRTLMQLGIKKAPLISPMSITTLINEVIKQQTKPSTIGDHFAASLFVDPCTIYCWGTLFGSWHSLLRDLQELQKQKIIDNDLTVIDKNCYLIFVGNVIGRSPYSLETLYTVLLLMKKNPERVFFIRGPQEDKQQWQYGTLGNALRIRMWVNNHDFYYKLMPLFKNLFSKLPLALCVVPSYEPDQMVVFSTSGLEGNGISPEYLGDLFEHHHQILNYYDIALNKPTEHPKKIAAVVRGEKNVLYSMDKPGQALEQLEPGIQSSVWALMSSPNDLYIRKAQFFYDTFAKIVCTKPFEKSTITLLYHDVRKKEEGFWHLPTYYLNSGLRVLEHEPIEKFSFGVTLPLTRSERILGQNVQRGITICFDENIEKLPQFITPYILDDAYSPSKARANVLTMLNNNISLLFLPIGGSIMPGYADLIKEKKISVLFPITGSSELRKQENSNILFLRPSYEEEVQVLLKNLLVEHAIRNIALFYHADPAGLTALNTAHDFLRQQGITSWTDVPYTSGTTNFKDHAEAIKKAQPDAIAFFATNSTISEELITTLGLDFLTNKVLFGISFLNEPRFVEFLKENGLQMFFANVVPNPELSKLPVVVNYRKAFDAIGYKYDIFSLEAYIATSLLVEVLKNIKGKVTKEAIFSHLEKLDNYEFQGLKLTFDPKTRTLLHQVWFEKNMDQDWTAVTV